MKKFFLSAIVVIAISLYGLNKYVEIQLDKMTHNDAYNNCNKIWSARGLYSNRSTENTIDSFEGTSIY